MKTPEADSLRMAAEFIRKNGCFSDHPDELRVVGEWLDAQAYAKDARDAATRFKAVKGTSRGKA